MQNQTQEAKGRQNSDTLHSFVYTNGETTLYHYLFESVFNAM